MRPWTAPTRANRAASLACFNGATALRPWTAVHAEALHCGENASMGPRPCGRGRSDWAADCADAAQLQWGHGLAAVDGGVACPRAGAPAQLQWGHGLAAVDGNFY